MGKEGTEIEGNIWGFGLDGERRNRNRRKHPCPQEGYFKRQGMQLTTNEHLQKSHTLSLEVLASPRSTDDF